MKTKVLMFAGCLATALAAGAAQADILCVDQSGTVKIQTFAFDSEDVSSDPFVLTQERSVGAFAVVNQERLFLTGTVVSIPNRVGNSYFYKFVDQHGAEVSLSTQTQFSTGPCTRAGCPDPVEVTTGRFGFNGDMFSLSCSYHGL